MNSSLPEPFATALAEARPADVADAPANSPHALFGRALARAQLGREEEARADLLAARGVLEDACDVELALLEVRRRRGLVEAVESLEAVGGRAPAGSRLAARCRHVLGLARAHQRLTGAALDELLVAREIYGELGDRRARAEVLDTLGNVHASLGRYEAALSQYALSLVDKTALGDLYGTALTLGNLGRLHLQRGDLEGARECFERDLELCLELGDGRGQARMREDLGRSHLAAGELDRAEGELRGCLALCERGDWRDLCFFAQADLARLELARGALDPARLAIEAAGRALEELDDPVLEAQHAALGGEWLLAAEDPRATEELRAAARRLAGRDLPDRELPVLLALARAELARGRRPRAEQALRRALALARACGQERLLRAVRETMAGLELEEGLVEERGRLAGEVEPTPGPDGYQLLERIGSGGFGEVYRAFDPQRHRTVVVKRLHLERIWNPAARRELEISARIELEAAARLRHPGVAQVLAVGLDERGGTYVVQEFVDGPSLRLHLLETDATAELPAVLQVIAALAHALGALHERGVVHRDVKPANVVLRERDGAPVLVDFGIARVEGFDASKRDAAGTPDYLAPERARGEADGPEGDVYALGAILYLWLAGEPPLELDPQLPRAELLEHIGRASRTPIGEHVEGLDESLAELVDRCLALDPAQRPTAVELARRLGTWLQG